MTSKAGRTGGASNAPSARTDRLKAALKANIARRKAQAAARVPARDAGGESQGNKDDGPKG